MLVAVDREPCFDVCVCRKLPSGRFVVKAKSHDDATIAGGIVARGNLQTLDSAEFGLERVPNTLEVADDAVDPLRLDPENRAHEFAGAQLLAEEQRFLHVRRPFPEASAKVAVDESA